MYSFDESLNEATQSCEVELYVRYWDSCNNETKTRYQGSSFLSHGRHQDLLKYFDEIPKDLDPNKTVSNIHMDSPNVQIKLYQISTWTVQM